MGKYEAPCQYRLISKELKHIVVQPNSITSKCNVVRLNLRNDNFIEQQDNITLLQK